MTRYPLEVLDPTAHLEDDLGIDSVKRAEILIALQKKFGLPSDLTVPAEMLTTIRNIAGVISSFVRKASDADMLLSEKSVHAKESHDARSITVVSMPYQGISLCKTV